MASLLCFMHYVPTFAHFYIQLKTPLGVMVKCKVDGVGLAPTLPSALVPMGNACARPYPGMSKGQGVNYCVLGFTSPVAIANFRRIPNSMLPAEYRAVNATTAACIAFKNPSRPLLKFSKSAGFTVQPNIGASISTTGTMPTAIPFMVADNCVGSYDDPKSRGYFFMVYILAMR